MEFLQSNGLTSRILCRRWMLSLFRKTAYLFDCQQIAGAGQEQECTAAAIALPDGVFRTGSRREECGRKWGCLLAQVGANIGAGGEKRVGPAPLESAQTRFVAQVPYPKTHLRHDQASPAP
jgi:hypothetical protein